MEGGRLAVGADVVGGRLVVGADVVGGRLVVGAVVVLGGAESGRRGPAVAIRWSERVEGTDLTSWVLTASRSRVFWR